MCQLSLVNNKYGKVIIPLLLTNGGKDNPDGTGLCWKEGDNFKYTKTKLSAFKIGNLGEIISEIPQNTIIAGHIRKTSVGVVSDNNAHPFVGKNIVLFHNGTLVKDGESFTQKDEKTDSERFMEEVDSEIEKGVELTQAVKNVMENWRGKFALIIGYNGKFYIFRGKTADLYVAKLKDGGYIVNTSKENIELTVCQVNSIIYPEKIEIEELKLVPQESIFDESLQKIGDIVEREIPKVVTHSFVGGIVHKIQNSISGFSLGKVLGFLSKSTREDISTLAEAFYSVYGKDLLSATEEEIKSFIEQVGKKRIPKRLKKILRSKGLEKFPAELYSEEIKFPWYYQKEDEIKRKL